MKNVFWALAVACSMATPAAVEIVAPRSDETVPLLSSGQKAYLALPLAERRAWLCDEKRRQEMKSYGWLPQKVDLRWKADAVAEVKLFLGETCVFATNGVRDAVSVDNLEIARTYTWTVAAGGDMAQGSFRTEDVAPRLLRIEGVPNARDFGGRIGLGGRRVRQGRVFRTAGLNKNAKAVCLGEKELRTAWAEGRLEATIAATVDRGNGQPHDAKHWTKKIAKYFEEGKPLKKDYTRLFAVPGKQIPGDECLTPSSRSFLLDVLGIKSDIDLRSDFECFGMTGSPLGPSVKWFHYPSLSYAAVQKEKGKEAFSKVFKVFLDERNYPIDFHCIAGQDRTGTVAFILNGTLGVDEDELYRDWEMSAFWNGRTNFNHKNRFDKLVASFDTYPGNNLRERLESFVKSLGFTDKDLSTFREIMLERR